VVSTNCWTIVQTHVCTWAKSGPGSGPVTGSPDEFQSLGNGANQAERRRRTSRARIGHLARRVAGEFVSSCQVQNLVDGLHAHDAALSLHTTVALNAHASVTARSVGELGRSFPTHHASLFCPNSRESGWIFDPDELGERLFHSGGGFVWLDAADLESKSKANKGECRKRHRATFQRRSR
jgi:hypothetical protein